MPGTAYTAHMTINVPLGQSAHTYARQFAAEQTTVAKGKQIYLNTLAVYALHSYLNWVQIDSQLDQSQSWDPVLRSLLDTADLELLGWGRLECRPALPGNKSCHIPPEATEERIGYVVVQISASMTEATLLGFVPTAVEGELSLEHLRPLEELFDHLEKLSQIEAKVPAKALSEIESPTVWIQLGHWLQGAVDAGWEAVASQMYPQPDYAFAFRSLQVKRRKPIRLATQSDSCLIDLVITLSPLPTIGNERTGDQIGVFVHLYPKAGQDYLSAGIRLSIKDADSGRSLISAYSQARDSYLPISNQEQLTGNPGDKFSVEIAWEDVCLTEFFQI
jgi:Protein of unknown function (DUF1822)